MLWERCEGNYAVAFSTALDISPAPDSLQMISIGHFDIPNPVTFPSHFEEFTFHLEQDLVVLVGPDPNRCAFSFFH
jgi:hypothetical protein